MPTYSLTLRSQINRKLRSIEVDNNFLYLQDLALNGTFSYIIGPTGPQGPQGSTGSAYFGGSFSSNTYVNWQTSLNSGTLPIGQFVEITDRADVGVLLYCSATNSFALEGTGGYINADYQNIGDYSSVDGFNSWQGIWNSTNELSYTNGDVVIWNNEHYLVTDHTQTNGDTPNNNPSAYFFLNGDNNGYITEWDIIIYDFINDNLKWRIDKRGNKISLYNSNFQWGDDRVKSIGMSTYESYIYIINNNGYINGSLSGLYSSVYINNNTNTVFFDIDGSSVALYSQTNSGNIECHIEGFSSGLNVNINSGDIKVYIYDSSYVSANNNSADIYAEYRGNSQVYHDNNISDIQYCEFVNCYIENFKSIYLNECNLQGLGNNSEYFNFLTMSGTWSYKYYTPYESTFDYQLDNTYITALGLSPSDITWYELTIPSNLSFVGNFSLNLDRPYNIMSILGNKEGLPVRLETTNYTFNIYSLQDSEIGSNCVLSTSYNTNTSNGISPIYATDSYHSFMVYPIQYWVNSGVSSYIELQRKVGNLSINRVIGYGGWSSIILPTVITIAVSNIGFNTATSGGNVISEGSSSVIARGVCINTSGNPTISDGITIDGTGSGTFSSSITGMSPGQTYYVRSYATNESGTAYGNQISFETMLCLVAGTKILLSDRTYKNIEDINYSDELVTWNFDEGRFDISKPLWIKKPQTTNKYNLLKFSDGSELKTIVQHRIFNKEKGMFTYPMTIDTPIGTTTFNSFGKEIKLISKEIINETVDYYNVFTNGNINLFSNDILTSCKYNNIYPIVDMKFVKDNRQLRSREEFINIPDKYIDGLRLCEQKFTLEEIELYINIKIKHEVEYENIGT